MKEARYVRERGMRYVRGRREVCMRETIFMYERCMRYV